MAMRRRRDPARKVLTVDVGRTGEREVRKKREQPGPFGGMNMRHVPRDLMQAQTQPAARARPESRDAADKPKTRSRNDDRPLYHALKMQQTLTPMSYIQRDRIRAKLDKIETFEELGLTPAVVDAVYSQVLPGLETYTPTPAQKLAVPALLKAEESQQKNSDHRYDTFMLAAETGSGKTLAYLLPVIDNVKRQEEIDKVAEVAREEEQKQRLATNVFEVDPHEADEKVSPSMGRPRAIILMPSSELVTQVGKVAKLMSHTVKYRVEAISSANTPTVIRSRLFRPSGVDIVVSTPHLISSIAEKEPNILSRVQYLVVDEADSLFDRSFNETTQGIIDRAAPSLKQLILCSATIPRSLDKYMDRTYPNARRLVTPKLHSIERRVQLGMVDIDKPLYRGNRDLACADVIWTIGKAVHDDTSSHHTVKCMMVFVNERERAEEVAKFLASKGVDAVPFTRDTSEQRQNDILDAFTSSTRFVGNEKPAQDKSQRNFRDFVPLEGGRTEQNTGPSRHLPNVKVLVTTDLGSRGIDTLAVRHVILYDVPHTTIDFIHRLGRLGRMGRRGRGVVLVGKHDRKDIVREVREAMHKGQALI
ncbi:ATP-dependent RNA helicase mrh4, mitochondrial [Cyphellophora attinorum]|uniref:RNA helicase n=1 Tax=Cyphellophora attinorum TaxID=1664694 RepID=A0A0N0NSJ3_9EURO|nr:ATP-dependent RNA helicase mrh4, mitochondrial [Phialophora attinorum]KPI46059.1 ATP-dependent RNA helicase mrh4, mitochondrial [Phialophora attinorum]